MAIAQACAGTRPSPGSTGVLPRASSRRLLLASALLALAAAALSAQQTVPAPAVPALALPARAILARGPEGARGLPFFSPNAIPSLRADYILVSLREAPADAAGAVDPGRGYPSVRLWCTRERLVLGPSWQTITLGDRRARLLPREGTGPVLALVSDRYTLLFELPEDSSVMRAFALNLERRFALYFENAPTDAELSFPAFVDLPR